MKRVLLRISSKLLKDATDQAMKDSEKTVLAENDNYDEYQRSEMQTNREAGTIRL